MTTSSLTRRTSKNKSMDTYNGWANYATWRVNLELFDGMELQDFTEDADEISAYDLGQNLREWAESVLFEVHQGEIHVLVIDYANAFLANVNWTEIAHHFLENNN